MFKYGVISGLYFPVFGLNMEICSSNLCIKSKYRKIRTRNNLVFGHFSRSKNAPISQNIFMAACKIGKKAHDKKHGSKISNAISVKSQNLFSWIMNDQDFHDGRLRFYYKQLRFSC